MPLSASEVEVECCSSLSITAPLDRCFLTHVGQHAVSPLVELGRSRSFTQWYCHPDLCQGARTLNCRPKCGLTRIVPRQSCALCIARYSRMNHCIFNRSHALRPCTCRLPTGTAGISPQLDLALSLVREASAGELECFSGTVLV